MVFGLSAFVWEAGTGAAYAQQPVVLTDHGAEPLAVYPLAGHTLDPNHPATAQPATAQEQTP